MLLRFWECYPVTFTEHAKQGVRCIAFHPGGVAETALGQKAPEQFRSLLNDTGMVLHLKSSFPFQYSISELLSSPPFYLNPS